MSSNVNLMQYSNKAEQNNIKSIINHSYNKLYCEFTSDALNEVGNYKILNQIGEGSFGKVYLALHKPTHRKVVLKTSRKDDPNIVREVFYHRQFDYPYITKLYEIITTETKVWMALEYCSGKELYDHLLKLKTIPIAECMELFAQIVGAVYYAHSLNCVHRDLKLENILLDKNGNAKLTDFGFTREAITKNTLETICGTTVYMAPELTERKNYNGFKIDIWALGIILYTMICGTMPFDEDDETKTKWKIVNEMPDFNNELLTEDSKDLLIRLLNKNAEERPTARDILQHNFLQPFGSMILEKTDKTIIKQRRGATYFHSRVEKRLLKRLNRSGFDTHSIKQSLTNKKCDSLSGLWSLLLEKEKKFERRNHQKRSRSVLSVRKVMESSFLGAGTNQPSDDATILRNNSEISKVTSITKIINKTADVGLNLSPYTSRKASASTQALETKPNRIERSSSNVTNILPSRDSNHLTKKNNIFKRVSEFFKVKLHNDLATSIDERGRSTNSSSTISTRTTSPHKNSTDKKKKSSPGKKKIPTTSNLNHNSTTQVTLRKTDVKKSVSSPKIQIDEPQIKRFKSVSSNENSRQTSYGNYDNETSTALAHFSEIKKVSLSQLHSRPLSSISQISNDTYTSDYSTDGTISFFQRGHTNEPKRPCINETLSTGDLSHVSKNEVAGNDKLPNNINKYQHRYITRNLSVKSDISSNSERSSRTDSFYDITTSSPPIIHDLRNVPRSSSLKESVLPMIGNSQPPQQQQQQQQHSWSTKRVYATSRRSPLYRRGRTHKSHFLKKNSSANDYTIKEEDSNSSSGGGPDNLNDEIPNISSEFRGTKLLAPRALSKITEGSLLQSSQDISPLTEGQIEDEDNQDTNFAHSDSEAFQTSNKITCVKPSNTDPPSPIGRNISDDSGWASFPYDSKSILHSDDDDDDESEHGADLEDNFSDADFDQKS